MKKSPTIKGRTIKLYLFLAIPMCLIGQPASSQSSGEWHFIGAQRWDYTPKGYPAPGDGGVEIKIIRFDEQGGEAEATIQMSQSTCARGGLEGAAGPRGQTEVIGFKWNFTAPIVRLRPGDLIPLNVETWIVKSSTLCPGAAAYRTTIWVTNNSTSGLTWLPEGERFWGYFSQNPNSPPAGMRWNFEAWRPEAKAGRSLLQVATQTPATNAPQLGWFAIVFSTNATTGGGQQIGFFYTYQFGPEGRKKGCGLGSEWSEMESGFAGRWIRRGTSNVFDARWDIGVTAVMTVTLSENTVNIARRQSSDGNDCDYTGTIQADGVTVEGTYTCKKGANQTPWRATIRCGNEIISGCKLAGKWLQVAEGVGSSMWTIDDTGKATESGLGAATGTATLSGNKLKIEWVTGGWSGTYEWQLDPTCSKSVDGILVFKSGGSGTRKSSVTRQ